MVPQITCYNPRGEGCGTTNNMLKNSNSKQTIAVMVQLMNRINGVNDKQGEIDREEE